MKILYIVPFVPWPVRVRSFNLIPRLARRNAITLVSVCGTEPTPGQTAWLGKYCQKAVHVQHSRLKALAQCAVALPTRTPLRIAYCRSEAAKAAVGRICDEVRPDVIYVERWRALQFVPEHNEARVICDPTDSMTLYNRRLMKNGESWEKLIGWEEHRKFLRYEGKLARQADVCVFCSQVDMECVKQQAPEVHYELVPNGVDCEKFFFKNENEEEPGTIVFAGSFRYRPNVRAARFFLEKVFSIVRKKVPGAKFAAVGNGASAALAAYRELPGVEIVDFVPDLRPYLARAAVAVAPLTVGSGVSNKLAEGFAVGTAVVATPLACGDLEVKSGEELLIADGSEEFAQHVVALLLDSDLRRRLALRARAFVERQYDWEIVSGQMEAVMENLVGAEASKRKRQTFVTA